MIHFFRTLLFITYFIPTALANQPSLDSTYHVIKTFDKDWYCYDANQGEFIPQLEKSSSPSHAHTTFIEFDKYKHYTLMAISRKVDGLLYINGLLYHELKADQWFSVDLKEVASAEELMSATIFGSRNFEDKEILIASKFEAGHASLGIERDNLLAMRSRTLRPFQNSCILMLVFVLMYTTILSSSNPKAFGEYFSINDIFTTKIRDTKFLISKPLNRVNQSFVVLLSFSTALLFMIFASNGLFVFNNPFELNRESGNLYFILVFLITSAACYLMYVAKFIFLKIMAQLFGIDKTVNIHYFKSIQFTLVLYVFLGFIFYTLSFQIDESSSFNANLVYWAIFSGYLLRSILTYFSILKSTRIQSLYLIAYLCVVEILPITLGLRLAF